MQRGPGCTERGLRRRRVQRAAIAAAPAVEADDPDRAATATGLGRGGTSMLLRQ
jgi:hypothetical protein